MSEGPGRALLSRCHGDSNHAQGSVYRVFSVSQSRRTGRLDQMNQKFVCVCWHFARLSTFLTGSFQYLLCVGVCLCVSCFVYLINKLNIIM